MAAEATGPEGDEGTVEPTTQVVEFTVSGERFAVSVGDVDSIEELTGTTRVPRTGEAIDGVMDLRGEITAIINPRVHLDVATETVALEQQVLVLEQTKDKQKIGLRVDEVVGVEEYPESAIVDSEDVAELAAAGIDDRLISAIIKRDIPEGDFEPIGWINVDTIIELSRPKF